MFVRFQIRFAGMCVPGHWPLGSSEPPPFGNEHPGFGQPNAPNQNLIPYGKKTGRAVVQV